MILRICLFLLALSACGGEHNSGFKSGVVTGVPNGEWQKRGAERHALSGVWRSTCYGVGTYHQYTELRVFDDRTLLLQLFYSDPNCKRAAFEQVFRIGGTPRPAETRDEWELPVGSKTIEDVLQVPTSPDAVRAMSRDGCLAGKWKLNQARSVYGSSCFAKETEVGVFRLRKTSDPSLIQLRYPGADGYLVLQTRL